MAHTASCPACGAPVEFKSAVSVMAVCSYCQSTLLRNEQTLADIGKMAALRPDNSPLQLGAEGRAHLQHFAVVGRIQLRYEDGMWNEWHLLFDDGRSGWLSEASGEYVLSFAKWLPDTLPTMANAVAGDTVWLDGTAYAITNVLTAECVAGEGELPFKVGSGYPAPLIDLRAGDRFATIDYSDGKPLVFIGAPVAFAAFGWSNLRQGTPPPTVSEKATALSCPECGAAMSLHSDAVEAVGCQHCGAVSHRYAGQLKLWAKASGALQAAPWLPLASRGELRGETLEVIGALVRSTTVEGVAYAWREYLLVNEQREFRWLTEYNGHWNLARVLSAHPKVPSASLQSDVSFDNQRFEHFESSKAEVDYVIGEFNWKVRVGEKTAIEDYICPPRVLSRESTRKEVTWTLGEYVEPGEIATAFRTTTPPPERVGVGASQPSPLAERHQRVCKLFWKFALAALAIQLLSVFVFGQRELVRQVLEFDPADDEPVLTREFKLEGRSNKLSVRHHTDLADNWVGLGMTLVEKGSGQAWADHRELSYYSGVDSDGSWSEGSQNESIVFRDLPPGTYVLAIEPDLSPEKPVRVRDDVIIIAGERIWSNLVFALLALALFPIFTRWRQGTFEIKRWADSDHPKVSEADDDDD